MIKLKLDEFEDAESGEITPRVSAGQERKIRIRPQAWNMPIDDIKKLLPQYTVARKFMPLSEENTEMLKHKKEEFNLLCQK